MKTCNNVSVLDRQPNPTDIDALIEKLSELENEYNTISVDEAYRKGVLSEHEANALYSIHDFLARRISFYQQTIDDNMKLLRPELKAIVEEKVEEAVSCAMGAAAEAFDNECRFQTYLICNELNCSDEEEYAINEIIRNEGFEQGVYGDY